MERYGAAKAGVLIAVILLISACSEPPAQVEKNRAFETARWDDHAAVTSAEKEFIHNLLDQMTPEEKAGQCRLILPAMDATALDWAQFTAPLDPYDVFQVTAEQKRQIVNGQVGGVLLGVGPDYSREIQTLATQTGRLGIPLLQAADVVNGFHTMFPIPLAQAGSFDSNLVMRTSRAMTREATAAGINWTFAPMAGVSRNIRWGQNGDTAGESPYLVSQMVEAQIRGIQGEDLAAKDTMMATATQFVAQGGTNALEASPSDADSRDLGAHRLSSIHMPPFNAAIKAGVGAIMVGAHRVNGQPVLTNADFLIHTLKDTFALNGFVVAAWQADAALIGQGAVADGTHAVKASLAAGVDMFPGSDVCFEALVNLSEEYAIPSARLDDMAARILLAKYRLGLFDDPFKYIDSDRAIAEIGTQEMRTLAREAARKSIILLENKDTTLPLKADGLRLAAIGPLMKDTQYRNGPWSAFGAFTQTISLYEGLKSVQGLTELTYAPGSGVFENIRGGQKAALKIAMQADAVILALGRPEGVSAGTDITLPAPQIRLAKALVKSGKPVIVVLHNAVPVATPWLSKNVDALLESWALGSESGHAIADILFGKASPTARLPVTIPYSSMGAPVHLGNAASLPQRVLYPFGWGRSYTHFSYEGAHLTRQQIGWHDATTLTVRLHNTGTRQGTETVQLYAQRQADLMAMPQRRLVGFQQITLAAGEAADVTFSISKETLALLTPDLTAYTVPGKYHLFAGAHALTQQMVTLELLASGETADQRDTHVRWRTSPLQTAQQETTLEEPKQVASVRLVIDNIPAKTRSMIVRIYDSEESFDRGDTLTSIRIPVSGTKVTRHLRRDLVPGAYVLEVFQDTDGDGVPHMHPLGLPVEAIVYSNKARIISGEMPPFQRAAIQLAPGENRIELAF